MDQKHPKRPRDTNEWAKRITDIVAGEVEEAPEPEKDAAAAAMGKKGGKARAEKMSAERRSEIAREAARKRWNR